MTLKAEILVLFPKGYSASEIANIVGCGTSHVRAVKQRGNSGLCDADHKYRSANPRDPNKYRDYMREYMRNRYQTDPEFRRVCLDRAARYRRNSVAKPHS